MASKEAVQLYRSLLRSSRKFTQYNFREYFLRRTREDFRAHKAETDPAKISNLLQRGKQELEVIDRQGTLSSLFSESRQHVIEMKNAKKA